MDLDEVLVHSHACGSVAGRAGDNWPRRARKSVRPVRLAVLDTDDEARRSLHAKAFELLCERGRLLVSGSPNGTVAALHADHNVEACVVRIQREQRIGWSYGGAEPPDAPADLGTETEGEETHIGVLRAVVDADEVTGQILTPKMSGTVSVYCLSNAGAALIGATQLAPNGGFTITAPDLEPAAMRGGRLVIRVEDGRRRTAEGFVSVASFADITRRAGPVSRQLLALIAGDETPADVAAILSWFHENPRSLAPSDAKGVDGGGGPQEKDDSEGLVTVAALERDYAADHTVAKIRPAAAERNWWRFIDQILASFRESRGPVADNDGGRIAGDDDEPREDRTEREGDDRAIARSLSVFRRLFGLLTKADAPARHKVTAFDLTQYVCDRLRPEPAEAKEWIDQLIRALVSSDVPRERREDIAATVLLALGGAPTDGRCRWARSCVLRLGVDLDGPPPSAEGVVGYRAILAEGEAFAELWARLGALRTFGEQVAEYRRAFDEGTPSNGYPDLPRVLGEEWPSLEAALTSRAAGCRIIFTDGPQEVCPRCYVRLPSGEVQKLRSIGVGTAKGCCGWVIIREGA